MFLSKNPEKIRCNLNYLGKSCFDLLYKGGDISDIKCFLNDVLIELNDPLKESRDFFYSENLKQNLEISTSKLIYNDMLSFFINK